MKDKDEGHTLDAGAQEFEQRVGTLLVETAAALDGRTRSALTRARHAALAQTARSSPVVRRWSWRGLAPAGAVAMAMLVVVFYAGQAGRSPATPPTLNAADDFALVSDVDAFDLSDDADLDLDSDFYEWAAATGGASGSGQGS